MAGEVSRAAAEVVVAGAGIAGIAAAWRLAAEHRIRQVLLVDPRPPLSLTSDKSTECYRNWWPHPAMVALVERSLEAIARLERTQPGRLAFNRNGYLYLADDAEGREQLLAQAELARNAGAGPLREYRKAHEVTRWVEPDWDRAGIDLDGADAFLEPEALRAAFPWVAPEVRAGLHVRRAGWLSAQQLGMALLEEARALGVEIVEGSVEELDIAAGRLKGLEIRSGQVVHGLRTGCLVVAVGPCLPDFLQRWGGTGEPLVNEPHFKLVFDDSEGVLPRHAPLVIWGQPISLSWTDPERQELAADPNGRFLLEPLPGGAHFRPEGGARSSRVLLLWNFDARPAPFVETPRPTDWHVPVVLQGIARIVPGFARYLERGRKPFVDGGFYTLAPDELPLIGPLLPGPDGVFLLGALGGFGIMTALGASEILARHVAGLPLPAEAKAFLPARLLARDPAAGRAPSGAKL